MKVLDFSEDGDGQPDSNGEYTRATLEAGPLPESFTICSAFMTEAWTTRFTAAEMFSLMRVDGRIWGYVNLFAGKTSTDFEVMLGPVNLLTKLEELFFTLQWIRACLSVDSVASKVMLVVDGQLVGEEKYRSEEDKYRPANISLLLGFYPNYPDPAEYTGRVSELNIFKSSLSPERMIDLTRAGGDECGTPGDLVSWEEAEWTLHSQAKVIEVDREWEGPCRRESQVQVFTAQFAFHKDCMHHCQKISNGRSPTVKTKEEWESLTREIDLVTQDRHLLPWMWLSVTEGDVDEKLTTLDHWPETEIVNNETKKLEAAETAWRDFYTGHRLDNWTKPYLSENKDASRGKTDNCIVAFTDVPWNISWGE